MLLTSLAMIASACVVVWVVSSYDAMVSQFDDQAADYLGRYDCFVVPEDAENAVISSDLIAALRESPDVAEVCPASQTKIRIVNPNAVPPLEMGGESGGPRGGRERSGTNAPAEQSRAERSEGRGPSGSRALAHSASAAPGEKQPPGSPPPRRGRGRRGFPGMMGSPTLVGTDAEYPPYPMAAGKWIDPSKPTLREVVVSKDAAEQYNAAPGDEILVINGMKEYRVKVIGIIEPAQRIPGSGMPRPGDEDTPPTGLRAAPAPFALYTTTTLADKFTRGKAAVNLVNVKLTPTAKAGAAGFLNQWDRRIREAEPKVSILGPDDIRSSMEEGFSAARAKRQAWAATGLSLLAALFIIFTTLSMGVTERVRQFAVMRAVGLTRGQVAMVIAAESLILAGIGWGGGLLAGWGLLAYFSKTQPDLFANGASLGTWCVALTGLSAFGGALAASVLPAWRATSVEPLEAMSPQRSRDPRVARAILLGVVGLALIVVNPVLVFIAAIPDAKHYAVYEAMGFTSMAIGFLLLAPAAILSAEAALSPPIARLLRLDPRLLRSQLGSNLWRTLGTTAALCVGLGLFVAMQVWGYSMLQPFTPGPWVPDALVAIQVGGFPDGEIEAVRNIPGVLPDKCIPLAVEQPKLADDVTGSRERVSVTRQGNVIVIGLDPETAFGGNDPLIKADFTDGNRKDAVAKLQAGGWCIVPDHFMAATGLNVGDSFTTIPPETPNHRVTYKIAGAIALPGWHWMTKFSGLRRRDGRSAAIVFTNYEDARRDFNLTKINFFWMNIDETASIERIGEAIRHIAERNRGELQPVNAQGTWAFGARMFGEAVRISTPEQVREQISNRASGMIWAMCQLPLITLLVTSLGVVNTVMASVRARRWEFGVLRSLGVTRSALFRMILAEGLLIGLITCLLSLGFGVLAGWCGTGISQYVSFFGGLETPLVIPWARLSLGFGIALGLCLSAALWPAVLTGRTEPLKLLQAGRAAL